MPTHDDDPTWERWCGARKAIRRRNFPHHETSPYRNPENLGPLKESGQSTA